jgi:hypothetical protein
LSRIRLIWRPLPCNGVLLFFDVKPIAVKTCGGRRYTSARRPVIPRRQKIRGLFSLFLLSETNSGRTRWAFAGSKDSAQVCRLKTRVRRWSPEQEVWIALAQDRPHPLQSRPTRPVLRARWLPWISLRKGSPDDNPVETINSDLQSMILDTSDDPDPRATRRRISAPLRDRNRRTDHRIRIPSLGDSRKHY